MNSDLRRLLPIWAARPASPEQLLAVILLVFVPLNFLYGAVLTHLGAPEKNDFTSYYVAAKALSEGEPGALYYPEPVGSLLAQASVQHPWIDIANRAGVANPNYYLYPPLFAVAFIPLAALPYKVAFAVWLLLNVGFLVASLLLCLPPRERRTLLGVAASVLLAGASYPVWHHLKIGQSSLLVLLLLAASLALLRRGRETAAGAILSGAILLKLTPVIFVALFLIRRRWRAAGAAIGGVAALSLLSGFAAGWKAQVTYFTRMVPLLSAGTAFYPNQSLNGFLTRLLSLGDDRKADLSVGLPEARLLAGAAAAIVLGLSLLLVWRRRREAEFAAEEDGFALLVVASLLASPISWEHHYVALLLPAWILVSRWCAIGAARRGAASWAGVALALSGSYIGVAVFEKFGLGPLRPLLDSAATLGGAALWILFATGWAGEGGGRAPAADRGGGRPAAAALLTMMAVFTATQFLLKVAEYDTSFSYGDFTSYYVAASAVVEGRGDALYFPETRDQILAKAEAPSPWKEVAEARGVRDANYYLYPPFFALLVGPLGLMPYAAAHDLWYVVNLAALAISLAWLARRDRDALTLAEIAGSVILTALLWPALFTFGAGQANFIVLFFLLASLLTAERSRRALSGLFLAGATLIKMTPGLLVAWLLWRRRWALVAWTAAAMAALTAACVISIGWTPHAVYLERMVPLLSRGCAHWVNQSVPALLSRLGGGDIFAWDLATESWLVRLGSGAASLAAIGGLAFLTRPGGAASSIRLEYALVLVTTLLLSPISWIHHAVLSLPAILFLIRHLIATGRLTYGRAALLAAAFALIAIYVKPFGVLRIRGLTPLASYPLAGQILLWGLLATEIHRLRKPPELSGAPA